MRRLIKEKARNWKQRIISYLELKHNLEMNKETFDVYFDNELEEIIYKLNR